MGQTTPDVFLSFKNLVSIECSDYFQSPYEGVGDQHSENSRISHCIGLGAHFQSITMSQLSNGSLAMSGTSQNTLTL